MAKATKKAAKKKRVLLFPLGWKNVAKLYKAAGIPAKYKTVPGWIVLYKDDYKIFDRIKETALPEADDAKIHEFLAEVVGAYRSSYVTWLVPIDDNADLGPAYHATATMAQAQKSFEQDGYEVVLCETAPNVPPPDGTVVRKTVDLAKTLARVSKNLLWKHPVPPALKALWEGQAHGDGVIGDVELGEVTLFDALPADIERDFIKNGPKLLREVGFIGREADGGIIGLWRYDAKRSATEWPVIYVDSEGQVSMPARTLQELFEKRHKRARAWFKARKLTTKAPKTKAPSLEARLA